MGRDRKEERAKEMNATAVPVGRGDNLVEASGGTDERAVKK